jgi:hypothetical protein
MEGGYNQAHIELAGVLFGIQVEQFHQRHLRLFGINNLQ